VHYTLNPAMRLRAKPYEWGLLAGTLLLYVHILQDLVLPFSIPAKVMLALYVCTFGLFLHGFVGQNSNLSRVYTESYWVRLGLFTSSIILFTAYGTFRGNNGSQIKTELLFFGLFCVFLLIGGKDRVWYLIDRQITIMVYVGFVLMLLYRDVLLYTEIWDPWTSQFAVQVTQGRYAGTVAMGLRPLIAPAQFLFVWGAVNHRRTVWKILQIGTIVPLLITDVGMFKFRNVFALTIMTMLMLFLVYPLLAKQWKARQLALVGAIAAGGIIVLIVSGYWTLFVERVLEADARQGGIFQSRLDEMKVFFSQMGKDIWFGRGLGGSYDASTVFVRYLDSSEWRTVHFGLLGFMLRGGIAFLLLFCLLFVSYVYRRSEAWYRNECNLTAILLLPVMMIHVAVNPIVASPAGLTRFLVLALALARLGTLAHRSTKWRLFPGLLLVNPEGKISLASLLGLQSDDGKTRSS
jgi:hypothetical protein